MLMKVYQTAEKFLNFHIKYFSFAKCIFKICQLFLIIDIYHELQSGGFLEMAGAALRSLPFVAAKIEAGKIYELLEDYVQVFIHLFII